MGKVRAAVQAHIENGDVIAAVVPAQHVVAAGVSNWGGWAIAAAACPASLPTLEEEVSLVAAVAAAGARDGITGSLDSVDGLPMERHYEVLADVRELALGTTRP